MNNLIDLLAWRLARASAAVDAIQQSRTATRADAYDAMQEFVRAATARNEAERRAREHRTQALAEARKLGLDGQVRS